MTPWHGFDEESSIHDEPTVIRSRESIFGGELPPDPFALAPAPDPHRELLDSLPPRARAVLEAARRPAPRWPLAPRIGGAVAVPRKAAPRQGPAHHPAPTASKTPRF
ncbi:MAG: hypothetical protein KC416_00540 [Myxococcales bacterium]|nr:hypothetical protein [Myxococcales bacterium]